MGWGGRGDASYFNNPMDSVAGLHGPHLGWLQSQLSLLLVADIWGHDVIHYWSAWRAQIAHHLPRFV